MAPFCIVDILISFPCLPQPLTPKINVEFWSLKSLFYFRQHWFGGWGEWTNKWIKCLLKAAVLNKCVNYFCPWLQLHGLDWKVKPSNFRLGFRSIKARGTGKAFVDLPLRRISHVFLKFSCIRLTNVHSTIDLTSLAAELLLLAPDFTGILKAKSSANFT